MLAAFGVARAQVIEVCWGANVRVPETMLTGRKTLEMPTTNGAHVPASRSGSAPSR